MNSSTASTRATDKISLELDGGLEAAAKARRALRKLRGDLDPPLMETLRLLVTELVSNSVRHGQSDAVLLRVLVARSSVITEVTDTGPGFDPAGVGTPHESSGWGLFLVERLAHRWGVKTEGRSTKVWFELRRS